MNNLERKIDLLIALAVADNPEKRLKALESLKSYVGNELASSNSKVTADMRIEAVLQECGIFCSLLGHDYFVTAISRVVENPQDGHRITSVIYPKVANRHNTTPQRVERAMRHAIDKAWERGSCDALEQYFGYTTDPCKGRPTNSEFICQVAHHIRRQMSNSDDGGTQ